ncbi:MAG: TonB-dependent receptor, partial [Gammaproteobacteria bacterium]
SGQVLNVVLFEELDNSSVSWEINSDYHRDGHTQPGINGSYTDRVGNLDFVLSGVIEPRYDHQAALEDSVRGDYSPNDFIVEDRIRNQTTYELSANLNYEFSPQSSARFNALWAQNDNDTDVFRSIRDLTVAPPLLTIEREDTPDDRDNWEVGGDYEYFFDNGARFKVLFVQNQDNQDTIRERFELIAPQTEEKNLFLRNTSTTEEDIIRGSYTFDIGSNQDIEMGAERAITTLESSLALGLIDASGIPSPGVGGLVPQLVTNANSTVEETRYEPFIIHNWVINPRMSLESTILYEYSEIAQSGDVSNKRDFDFIKPKVDFRYDLTPTIQLRGTIEKQVQQLSFADFEAATDSEDDDSN